LATYVLAWGKFAAVENYALQIPRT